MKRSIIALIMALAMILTLVACGNSNGDNNNGGNDVTITYPDLTAFEEALAPVTESYCKQYGDEFTALYNQLKG